MNLDQYSSIFWDFGGVITSSPFEAFNEYEKAKNLPENFLRKVNSNNPHVNAWALLMTFFLKKVLISVIL